MDDEPRNEGIIPGTPMPDIKKDPIMGVPISECTDVEFLRATVITLWGIIDDIDSISDMVKDDDKTYRALVEKKQNERWEKTDITTDGYGIYMGNVREGECSCYAAGLRFHTIGCPEF